MKITIGIPTFRRPKFLIQTCLQVLQQNHSAVCEIIIADQTPWANLDRNWQDAIGKLQEHPLIQYFTLETPNLPGARNFILQKAAGNLIIWLDDDVLLPPGFIEAHYRSFHSNTCERPVIAVAGNPLHRVVDIADESVVNFDNYLSYCTAHYSTPNEFICDWNKSMIGANHSVLKSYAIKAQGYDENFIGSAGFEDTDFTFRLKKCFPDKFIAYNPDAWLIHLRSKTGGCRIEKKNKWSEYATIIGPQLCRVRHCTDLSLTSILRMSPLRKENIINPWRQPQSWFGFFKSLLLAHLLKNKVKSPFSNV